MTTDSWRLEIRSGSVVAPVVDAFYEKFSFRGRAREGDVFFLVFRDDQLVGAVRFCIDQDTPMLRTMLVDESCRGQGVGRRLLAAYDRYVTALEVRNIYCLPYTHLAPFYGSIGFVPVPLTDVPQFLQIRREELLRGGEPTICMCRP